jgi:membrane-bound lytic murein transglycosylase D
MKRFIIFFVIISIGILMFNFLSPNTKSDSIEDIIHQREFNNKYGIFSIVKPESISFAGENAPLFSDDIWERYDKEILKNVYWQSNTMLYLKRANKYFPIIEPILKQNNIPDDFKYLALIESGLENVVSPAGAAGFWQFMKGTAKDYGMEVNSEVDERYNLEKSTLVACQYLQKSYNKFGNWTMAAASYNVGINGLSNRSKTQKSNNYYDLYLPNETSRYVFRILVVKEILENPTKYGFIFREKDLYNYPKTIKMELNKLNVNLPEYALEIGVNYKILKQYNPWLRSETLINKNGKTYTLTIPIKEEINIFKTP